MSANDHTPHRVLLCGHRAFAAQGLPDLLSGNGCRVTQFSRGDIHAQGNVVCGPVVQIHENPHLDHTFDTVINFIVLKHMSMDENLAFIRALLKLCQQKAVRHLIHISSMSVYPDSTMVFTERARIRDDWYKYQTYANLKTAADVHLTHHMPQGIKLSLLRPAYILGAGLYDPVGSIGMRIAGEKLLVLGRGDRQRPVISRSVLHEAICRRTHTPPETDQEVLLMVDRDSPSCLEYLQGCCDILGTAQQAVAYPGFVWLYYAVLREVRSRRVRPRRFFRSILSRTKVQRYDPTLTEQRLNMSLESDWRADLLACQDGTTP
jgi:nucleoside-diphosphate-sugar epimerase